VDSRGRLFEEDKVLTTRELRNQLPVVRSLTQQSSHDKHSSNHEVITKRPLTILIKFFSWLKRNLIQILVSLRSAVSLDCNDRSTHSAQTLSDISGTETQLSVTWILTTLIYSKWTQPFLAVYSFVTSRYSSKRPVRKFLLASCAVQCFIEQTVPYPICLVLHVM